MRTKFTSTLKWVKTLMIMSCLTALCTSQLFAQDHHDWHHWFHNNDSTFHRGHDWNDTLIHFHRDSGHTWHDSGFQWGDSGHTWNDSGFQGGDSGHTWNDSGHMGGDSGHTWNDSGFQWGDSGHTWNDSGFQWGDSGHTWNDSGFQWNDSGFTWNDSGFQGGDSGHCFHDSGFQGGGQGGGGCGGGHRLANPNQVVTISIYPNPVMETATMHIENTSGNVTFRMYQMNGRLAMEQGFTNGDFQLNKGNLGAGVYFYEIIDGNTSVSKGKLIIQ